MAIITSCYSLALDKSGLLTSKTLKLLQKKINRSFRRLTLCQVQCCIGHPVCLRVIESVFSACKAPGSPSLVVKSSETGGVKSDDSVCYSSRYSSLENRVAQPVVQPLQGISHPCTVALTAPLLLFTSVIITYHWHIELSQANAPFLNTFCLVFWYLLFTHILTHHLHKNSNRMRVWFLTC